MQMWNSIKITLVSNPIKSNEVVQSLYLIWLTVNCQLSSECGLEAGSSAQDPAGGEHGSVQPVKCPDDTRAVLGANGLAARRGELQHLHWSAEDGHRQWTFRVRNVQDLDYTQRNQPRLFICRFVRQGCVTTQLSGRMCSGSGRNPLISSWCTVYWCCCYWHWCQLL